MTIDDESEEGKIAHYDSLGKLIIEQCAMHSYTENGEVAYAKIAKGHVVVNGSIEMVYTEAESSSSVIVEGNVQHAHAKSDGAATGLNDNDATDSVTWDYDGEAGTTHEDNSTDHDGNPVYDPAIAGEELVIEERTEESSKSDHDKALYDCMNINTGAGYVGEEGFRQAVSSASSNDKIIILNKIEVTKVIEFDRNLTLNFNGNTITNKLATDRCFHVHDCTLNIDGENGKFVIDNDSAYGLIKIDAPSADTTVNISSIDLSGNNDNGALVKIASASYGKNVILNLNNVTGDTNTRIQDMSDDGCCGAILTMNVTDCTFSSNKRSFHWGTYSYDDTATFNNVTITTDEGPCIEVDQAKAIFNNCNFTVTNIKEPQTWYSVCIGLGYEGTATINSGTYNSQKWNALEIYTTDGTFVINGGTFTGKNGTKDVIQTYENSTSVVNINGGEFIGTFDLDHNQTTTTIVSGTFTSDPTKYVGEGYKVQSKTIDGLITYRVVGNSVPSGSDGWIDCLAE